MISNYHYTHDTEYYFADIRSWGQGAKLTSLEQTIISVRFSLQVREKVLAKVGAAVVEAHLLVDLINPLHVLRVQLEVTLQVGPDATGRLGFAEHRVALINTPRCGNTRPSVTVSYMRYRRIQV